MNRKLVFAVASVAILATVGLSTAILRDRAPGETDPGIDTLGRSAHDYQALLGMLQAQGIDTLTDTDNDGLPDAMENYVYGSDPEAFSTTGNGVPDGWFARHGYDPTRLGVGQLPAAVPPVDRLPDVYNGHWPDQYVWTLRDAYLHGMPQDHPAETYWDSGIDPLQWSATPDGIPYAWLHHHGLDANDPSLFERRLGDDTLTVRENYVHDTDPNLADTDDDGLTDAEEIKRYGTDPRNNSTSGSGAPDGWLVHFNLDPADRTIGSRDPKGKGMTVAQVWQYNEDRFGRQAALGGAGIDPTGMSHRDDGIPDGWLIDNELDPLDDDIALQVASCASDFEDVRNVTDAPAGLQPIPDLCIAVGDAYSHGRPASWDEGLHGPWPGGLDPSTSDRDGDGLPDVVEIRGWYAARSTNLGPDAPFQWYHARSDPLRADTDGDGLTDREEYDGVATRDTTYRFPPTDPSNPDTAFSGMTDAEKVMGTFGGTKWALHEQTADGLRPLLDPTRRDTAGDYLADGAAMAYWNATSHRVLAGDPYGGSGGAFPLSAHPTYLGWINDLQWVVDAGLSFDASSAAALLAPDGDVNNNGVPNVIDFSASGDGIPNGWKVEPDTLRFSDFRPGQRFPMDPANPDTSGDGLSDAWKLQHGREFPAPAPGAPRWDLEPAAWDSNRDTIGDHADNLDGDVVTWRAVQPGEVDTNSWPYTNRFEFRQGTDPHAVDQFDSRVSDGWMYFWGTEYYNEVKNLADPDNAAQQTLEDLGIRVPSVAQMDVLRPTITDRFLDDTHIGLRQKAVATYFRVVEAPTSGNLHDLFVAGREKILPGYPAQVSVLRGGEQHTMRVALIEGTHRHTFSHDAALGLNPYLLDTDGDGMPDAWEALYAWCGLDPGVPDAHHDADGDGLSNILEFQSGTNPCLVDTDLDGIRDGAEVALGLNPLNPGDAGTLQGDNDGDGLSNLAEATGGTDPNMVDTDIDGLLDGGNLPTAQSSLSTAFIAELKALGIAHRITSDCYHQQAQPVLCFFGEAQLNQHGSNTKFDSLVPGVADGWRFYYSGAAKSSNPAIIQFNYGCGMPHWWDETSLGVWWWGMPPTNQAGCPQDRDLDGLHDANGEDPVPAASQANHAAAIDLRPLVDDASIPILERVKAGQAWGECAGNPAPCAEPGGSWASHWEAGIKDRRAPVLVTAELDGLDSGQLAKEQAFEVTGTVACDVDGVDECSPQRTVVVRLVQDASANGLDYDHTSSISQIIGVAFTEPNGSFTVSACLCAAGGSVGIPDGVVALGQQGGQATWPESAKETPVGATRFVGVHVYATNITTDPAHPQHSQVLADAGFDATQSGWTSVPASVRVTSGTTLTLSVPTSVKWSEADRTLPISAALVDSSGRPAPAGQTVTITVGNEAPVPKQTNAQGAVSYEYVVPEGSTGDLTIQAQFAGSTNLDPSSSAPATAILQTPMQLVVDGPEVARLGEPLTLTVQASSLGKSATGVAVEMTLGSAAATGQTGSNGEVTLTLTPSSQAPGPAAIAIASPATDHYLSAQATHAVSLVSGSTINLLDPGDARRGGQLPVEGRITRTDGTPIPGAGLQAKLHNGQATSLTADAEGRFLGIVPVAANLPIGSVHLTVTYDGVTHQIDAATAQKAVRVVVATRLDVGSVAAGRGQDVAIQGTLKLAGGAPLLGEEVTIDVPWGQSLIVRTVAKGAFATTLAIPADHALGSFRLNASYPGSSNQTFGASTASAPFNISAPSRLTADVLGTIYRGTGSITGRLMDAETGASIQASIQATLPDGSRITRQTGSDGVVHFPMTIGMGLPPGHIQAVLQYAGGDGYAPANATTHGTLRVPTSVQISAPPEFGRGTTQPVAAMLLDDRGQPVANRTITFAFMGNETTAATGSDGIAHAILELPPDAPLGHWRLEARWEGDDAHEPYRAQHSAVIKDGVLIDIDGMPDEVQAGQRIKLRIAITDTSKQPVQTPVLVRIDGVPGSLLTATDEAGNAEIDIVVPDTGTKALRVTVRFPGTDLLAARSQSLEPTLSLASTAPMATANAWPWGLTAAVAAAIAVAAVAAVAMRKRGRSPAAILRETANRIAAGDPWSITVLKAYQRLQDLVQDYGITDDQSQTGRAFAQSLVDFGILNQANAIQLVALFERARYAGQNLHEKDAFDARRVLENAAASVRRLRSKSIAGGAPA